MSSESLVSYETLVHAISGACGSVCAMALTVPLDTTRTRLILDEKLKSKKTTEVLLHLLKEEGVLSLFRGVQSTLQSVASSSFVYFYTFHGLKKMAGVQGKQSAVKDLLFACLAGSCNVLLTNPLWVVNTRLKMQGTEEQRASSDRQADSRRIQVKYKGLLDGLIKKSRHEGVLSLWSGTVPSLMLVSNPAIKFTAYEYLKRKILELRGVSALDSGQAFFIGVMSGLLATVVTYPIQIVQTKLRHGHGYKNLRTDASMLQVAKYIVSNFGVGYLYKGLDAKIIQSVITAGFMFLSYEQIAAAIFFVFGIQKKIVAK